MKWFRLSLPAVLIGFGLSLTSSVAYSGMGRMVRDPQNLIPPEPKQALESLLLEHMRLADQRIVLALFTGASEKPADQARHLSAEIGIGAGKSGEGVLVVVFQKEGIARLEMGFGMDSVVTPAHRKAIYSECLGASALRKDLARALLCVSYRILEVLESPLIESGKAAEILAQTGLPEPLQPLQDGPATGWVWTLFMILGCMVPAGVVLFLLFWREAHFTAQGWFHVPRLKHRTANQNSSIVSAISEAEDQSTAQIHVHLSKRWWDRNPEGRAERLYFQFGMNLLPKQNGVLLFLNLRERKFAAYSGPSTAKKLDQNYWLFFWGEVNENLRGTQTERAMAHMVTSLGSSLRAHFPPSQPRKEG